MSAEPPPERQRTLVVALTGEPNVGKSTLVNRLVGQKVAIVSPRAQTTRARLKGIMIAGDAQVVLVDTPGLAARPGPTRLQRAMVAEARAGAAEAGLVLLVADSGLPPGRAAERLAAGGDWLVLNRIDEGGPGRLLPLMEAAGGRFQRVFAVSALSGDGVDDLATALAEAAPPGPWPFAADEVTTAPARALAAELTREQLLVQLGAEVPHQAGVRPESFEERADGSAVIRQQILVERASQRAIVLGAGGRRIRTLGEAARREMEQVLGRRVHLYLHVKVRPGWQDHRDSLAELGVPAAD